MGNENDRIRLRVLREELQRERARREELEREIERVREFLLTLPGTLETAVAVQEFLLTAPLVAGVTPGRTT